jgi:hypothetical protein
MLPVSLLVIILHITIVPLGFDMFIRFLIGVLFIVIGLTFFLIGLDKSITPMGQLIGEVIIKSNKLSFLLITSLILGFFISLAEPGLIVFVQQISHAIQMSSLTIILLFVVSIGVASLLAFSLYRIVMNFPLYILLTILYGIIFHT